MGLFAGKCHCYCHFLFSQFTLMQLEPEDFMAYLKTCLGYSSFRGLSYEKKKKKL